MIVDGEMAALNDKGVPDFDLMQHRPGYTTQLRKGRTLPPLRR